MFSSFPKYRLPDNLTSTNCMFLLTFLDFCPHLQLTTGLFSHFSCFLPSSSTDHRAFFSIFLFFALVFNRYPTFFKIFSDSRPSQPYNRQQKSEKQTLHHPCAFIFRLFLITPEFLITLEFLITPEFLITLEFLSSFQLIRAVRSYLLSTVSTKIL